MSKGEKWLTRLRNIKDRKDTSIGFGITLLGFILLINMGQIPAEGDSLSAKAVLQRGLEHWVQGRDEQALSDYRLAQKKALQTTDTTIWANATQQIGKYFSRNAHFDAAEITLDSVIGLENHLGLLHPVILEAYDEKGGMRLDQGRVEEGKEILELVYERRKQLPPGSDTLVAISLEILSLAHIYQWDLEGAQKLAEEALEIRKRELPANHSAIGYNENTLGIIKENLRKGREGHEHYLRAYEILSQHLDSTHQHLIRLRGNIANSFADQGQFWKAVQYHRKNEPYLDQLPPIAQLSHLMNMAFCLRPVEDFQTALEYLDRAELFMQKHPDLMQGRQFTLHDERGLIYQNLGFPQKALDEIENGIAAGIAQHGPNHPNVINALFMKGYVLAHQKRFSAALESFLKGYERLKAGPPSILLFGDFESEIGNSYLELGQIDQGIQWLELAAKSYQEKESHWNEASIYVRLASCYREDKKQAEMALDFLRKAWELFIPEADFSLSPDPSLAKYWSRQRLNLLFVEQGQILRNRYEGGHSIADLQAASASFQLAANIQDSLRFYYQDARSRQSLVSRQSMKIYEMAIQTALELHPHINSLDLIDEAFWMSEKTKSGNLRDALRSQYALMDAALPDSLVEMEQVLRGEFAQLQSQLQESTDSTLAAIQEKYLEVKARYQNFLSQLEQDFPNYYALKYPRTHIDLGNILDKLPEKTIAYSYFWGGEQLYIFRLYDGGIDAFQKDIATLNQDLSQWIEFISHPPSEDFLKIDEGYNLAQILLPELPDKAEQVLLFPDGPLAYLSFESLLVLKPDSIHSDFRRWEWLISQKEVRYAQSAELWLNSSRQSQTYETYTGWAPAFNSGKPMADASRAALDSLQLSPLIYNQKEVAGIADLLGGKALLGTDATESYLNNQDLEGSILHFATHTWLDSRKPLHSRLFLAADAKGTADGLLHAYELYHMRLNSPLVVLSACESGSGTFEKGEGVMSLARAFQYAGCNSLISTLWRTDDRSAEFIGQAFFSKLKKGDSRAEALRSARLDWIQQADAYYAHPYFWGGFVLVGDSGVLVEKGHSFLWSLMGLLLIVIGIFTYRKNKSRASF